MNKTKEISNRKIEKILNKCIILISRGYDIDYCLTKFKKYKKDLEEYFHIIGKFKNSFPDCNDPNCEPDSNFAASTLDKIYKILPEKSYNFILKSQKRNFIFKPAIIFILILVIFSFSFIGTIFASQNSGPNELLYKVKRTVEEIKVLTYPSKDMGPLHFSLLKNRLNETKKLINSNSSEKILVDKLFSDIEYEFEQSKKYNYFESGEEEETLNYVNNLKDEYLKKYGQNQENKNEDYIEKSSESTETQKDSNDNINKELNDNSNQVDKKINEAKVEEDSKNNDYENYSNNNDIIGSNIESTDENTDTSNNINTDIDENSSYTDSDQTNDSTSYNKDDHLDSGETANNDDKKDNEGNSNEGSNEGANNIHESD